MKLQIDFEIPKEMYREMRIDIHKEYIRSHVREELVKEIMKNDSLNLYAKVESDRNFMEKYKGELYVYNASDINEVFNLLLQIVSDGGCDSKAESNLSTIARILSNK